MGNIRGSGSEASLGRNGGGRAPLSVEKKISSRVGNAPIDEVDVDGASESCDDEDGKDPDEGSSTELLP